MRQIVRDAYDARQAAAAQTDGSSHTVSVIIRTKNEAASLSATLTGVLSQRLRPYEVFVIDSGSTDATVDIATSYGVHVLLISPQDWSYPRAINRAAEQATGEILVCLSAHCVPATPDWLGALVRHFNDPTVAGVWGPNLRPGRPLPTPGAPEHQVRGTYTVETRRWGLSNANSAIRRSLWEEFPFDESLPAAEDKAWGQRAMDRGYVIVHEPAAGVWHGRHTTVGAFKRNQAVMSGYAMLFPELQLSLSEEVTMVARAAWRVIRFNAGDRRLRTLWTDVRRLPTAVAAVVGAFVHRRTGDAAPRRTWRSSRNRRG